MWKALGRETKKRAGQGECEITLGDPARAFHREQRKKKLAPCRGNSLGAMALARPASFTKSSFHSLATGFRLLGYQKSLLCRNAGLSVVKQRQTTTMLARVSHVASLPFRRCERRSFVHSLRYISPQKATSQYDFRAFSVTEIMWFSSFPELDIMWFSRIFTVISGKIFILAPKVYEESGSGLD